MSKSTAGTECKNCRPGAETFPGPPAPRAAEGRSLIETTRDYKWKGLDIALLLDSTGSMAGLIRASKERIDEIIAELSALLPSLRVSGYLYRDWGSDYLYYGSPLTYDTWAVAVVRSRSRL